LLRDSDVAALPTHYKEGSPRFLMEAAASGLPLVATDIPGCREIVRDGVTGMLVPPLDVPALADALAKLLTNRGLREEMGRAARRMAEEEFSEAYVVARHLDLYREIGVL
jgi:glycosyltransferase involved in cell wall biosynthesis